MNKQTDLRISEIPHIAFQQTHTLPQLAAKILSHNLTILKHQQEFWFVDVKLHKLRLLLLPLQKPRPYIFAAYLVWHQIKKPQNQEQSKSMKNNKHLILCDLLIS